MKTKSLSSVPLALLMIFFTSCVSSQTSNPEFPPCALPKKDSFWNVDTPKNQGFNEEKFCARVKEWSNTKENIHSILIERHGKLVAEIYRTGSDRTLNESYSFFKPFSKTTTFNEATLHDQRSVSKSIIGLLVGISIDKGKLKPNSVFLDNYPQLEKLRTNGREQITIQSLLTMTAGLKWQEMYHSVFTSSETALAWKKDPVLYYFDRDMDTKPGEKFNYAGGSTMALADLLTVVNKRPLLQIAKDDLFTPLGISEWEWATNLRDVPMAYAGLRLKPRDMLKVGRLMNQGGKWEGSQLISQTWVKDSLAPHIPTELDFMSVHDEKVSYGYQWWTGELDWKGRKVRWSAAIGNGGQRIYVVPELDLTCVITAGDYGSIDIQKTVGRLFFEIFETLQE